MSSATDYGVGRYPTYTLGGTYAQYGASRRWHHQNVLLEEFDVGSAPVQSNQHVIVHDGAGMILDPGGNRLYSRVITSTFSLIKGNNLHYVFLSHQDPDVVSALNGWLLTTEADAYISKLWVRFVPHCWIDDYVTDRLEAIPDDGMILDLNGARLLLIPAHFLHGCGNFQVYDSVSKILYTGDLGASLGADYVYVPDFEPHLKFMEGFHKRYMGSNKLMQAWANMVRQLDIEIIAPQHGAIIRGKKMVRQFIDWCAELQCGADVITDLFKLPVAGQQATVSKSR